MTETADELYDIRGPKIIAKIYIRSKLSYFKDSWVDNYRIKPDLLLKSVSLMISRRYADKLVLLF